MQLAEKTVCNMYFANTPVVSQPKDYCLYYNCCIALPVVCMV